MTACKIILVSVSSCVHGSRSALSLCAGVHRRSSTYEDLYVVIFKRQFLFLVATRWIGQFLFDKLFDRTGLLTFMWQIKVVKYETLLVGTARHIKCGQNNVFKCHIFRGRLSSPAFFLSISAVESHHLELLISIYRIKYIYAIHQRKRNFVGPFYVRLGH